jgi:hypothetical protein
VQGYALATLAPVVDPPYHVLHSHDGIVKLLARLKEVFAIGVEKEFGRCLPLGDGYCFSSVTPALFVSTQLFQ